MQDMAFDKIDATKIEPMIMIDKTLDTVRPAGRFRPGGRLAQLQDAAERGDVGTMQTILVAMTDDVAQLRCALDGHDYTAALVATTTLGFEFFAVPKGIGEIIGTVKTSILLLNLVSALINVFSTSDSGDGAALDFINNRVNTFTVDCRVGKENKGCVPGDNNEAIEQVNVNFKTTAGLPPDIVIVNINLTAGGINQDSLVASLALSANGGPAQPALAGVAGPVGNGFSLTRAYSFVAFGTPNFSIDLTAPGNIAYGSDGANLTLQLDVSCRAVYTTGTVVQPQPVNLTALAIGLSI